jgi:hypothetical protein
MDVSRAAASVRPMAVAQRTRDAFGPRRPPALGRGPAGDVRRVPSWGWVAGCVLLTLALRAPFLGVALGRDEGGITYIARQWPGGHGSLYGAYWLDRPPLLVGLFKLAGLGGDAGVRALGALAAAALVVAVWRLGTEVAGEQAGRVAALLAALLTGSFAIGAVYTPAELLAAVPSTLSVLCLFRRRLLAAGLLAAAALLVKQSFLDAGVAGLAFLIVSRRPRWWLEYVAGAALPLAALAALPGFAYALAGFRIQALHTLAGSSLSLPVRLEQLAGPALASGLIAVLAAAVWGLLRLPVRAQAITLAAWFAGAAVGVLGGGSYWPHYLIELVPVTCVAAGALRPPKLLLAAAVALAVLAAVGGARQVHAHPPYRQTRNAAAYVRDHARPGDTQYVMYARANFLYYAGLPSPYPYHWSLMMRAKPGAVAQLRHLLASPRRPTWLVEWQPPNAWGLDRSGATSRLIAAHYRRVATFGHRPIYRAR